jgi:hypothetical protein
MFQRVNCRVDCYVVVTALTINLGYPLSKKFYIKSRDLLSKKSVSRRSKVQLLDLTAELSQTCAAAHEGKFT